LLGAVVAAALLAAVWGGSPSALAQAASCEDYTYQEDAQADYDADASLQPVLDEDMDTVACETLPRLGGPPAAPTETPADTTPEATPEPPVAGATYTGDVQASGDCGGGTVSVTVSADGAEVTSASVSGVGDGAGGTMTGSATFPSGAAPIGDDGSISSGDVYIQTADGSVTIGGVFDGSDLTGAVTVTPSTCGALSFSAVAGAVTAPTALPSTGIADDSSGGSSMPWAIVAGVLAALGLGAGAFVLRRRMA
jgi:LPXTG-motif cell wall-anchored protein